MAETNASHINDGPQQTDIQPSRESKQPKVFAGTAWSNVYF